LIFGTKTFTYDVADAGSLYNCPNGTASDNTGTFEEQV
jgi:hypothetical protein